MTCPTIDIPDLTNSKCLNVLNVLKLIVLNVLNHRLVKSDPGVDYPSVKDIVKGIFPGRILEFQ